MKNTFINGLVKDQQMTVKLPSTQLQICPDCGRIVIDPEANYCIHCPGVGLAKVEFE